MKKKKEEEEMKQDKPKENFRRKFLLLFPTPIL